MQEKIAEMMNLLNQYTKGETQDKVLVRKENSTAITKHVNAISIVQEDYQEVKEQARDMEDDDVEKGEVFQEDDIVENDKMVEKGSDGDVEVTPYGWGEYEDRMMEMPKSHSIGYYLKMRLIRKPWTT